jgi:hypothetical protein
MAADTDRVCDYSASISLPQRQPVPPFAPRYPVRTPARVFNRPYCTISDEEIPQVKPSRQAARANLTRINPFKLLSNAIPPPEIEYRLTLHAEMAFSKVETF